MKRLVLLGGGHAHAGVLADFARERPAGAEVVLVSPHARQLYSGMVPGWVAGHYPIEACAIALDALAARAGAAFRRTAAIGLDLARSEVECADGARLPFDLLSIDTGPVAAAGRLPGSAEHALPVRPIEGFVAAWPGVARASPPCPARGSPSSAPARRASSWPSPRGGAPSPRAGRTCASCSSARRRCPSPAARGGAAPARPPAGAARHRAGAAAAAPSPSSRAGWCSRTARALAFDACLAVTGAAAPAWPGEAGLAVDARGFIRVDAALRSVSHPQVHAAGDVAAHPAGRPRSGVYAVRAGPVLAASPARGVRGARACAVDAAAARALPAVDRRAPCRRRLGPLDVGRRLGLALEGPHRPRLRAALRRGRLSGPASAVRLGRASSCGGSVRAPAPGGTGNRAAGPERPLRHGRGAPLPEAARCQGVVRPGADAPPACPSAALSRRCTKASSSAGGSA